MLWMNNRIGPWGSGPNDNDSDKEPSQDPWGNRSRKDNVDFDAFMKKGQKEFKRIFPGGSGPQQPVSGKLLGGIFLILVGLWLASGLFTVQQDQQGVVLRFGKYNRTVEPGLNYHLPYPFETALVRNVTSLNVFTNNEGREGSTLMLTGDENIAAVQYAVTWYIDDLYGFLFSAKDPVMTIQTAAESTVRSIIAQTPIAQILSEGRTQINADLRERLQELLTEYGVGIMVKEVKLLKTTPPTTTVEDAYLDVQRARADMERKRNEAEFYRNSIVPVARGEAKKLVQEAKAYDARVRNDIEGETQRFLDIYAEYKKAPKVTRKRIYLETISTLFKDSSIVITDDANTQGVLPYLPLPQINSKKEG